MPSLIATTHCTRNPILCTPGLHRCQLGDTRVGLFTILLMLFHKAVMGLLLRWWLLTIRLLLFHKAVARLLLRWWLLTTFLRVGCWCVAGASFCAWAASGVLFLQGHHLCRALGPFCSGGWSYKAYCVLCPCPAKPASRGFAGVHPCFWGVV